MNVENELPNALELQEAISPSSLEKNEEQPNKETKSHFAQMNIRPELQEALQEMGFSTPLPIQAQTFSQISAGNDLLIQADQGAGKTAAFGLPLLQSILDLTQNGQSEQGIQIQGMILTASRERALKIQKDLSRLGHKLKLQIVALYGGFPMAKQVEMLSQGAHLVVGDPKRILDHLHRQQLSLNQFRVLIIDGMSELIQEGHFEEVIQIAKLCPAEKQTIVFSQKAHKELEVFAQTTMKNPIRLQFSSFTHSSSEREHFSYMVSGMARERDLVRVLDAHQPKAALIFCNTNEEVQSVTQYLYNQGLEVKGLTHSLHAPDQEKLHQLIKNGQVKYVVTSDFSTRGLPGKEFTHLIYFTFPETPEIYSSRMEQMKGQTGVVISLIGPRELGHFYTFKLTSPLRPVEQTFLPAEELQNRREVQYLQRFEKEMLRTPPPLFYHLARKMTALPDGERYLAILVERYLTTPKTNEGPFFSSPKEEKTSAHSESSRKPSDSYREKEPKREFGPRKEKTERKEHSPRSRNTSIEHTSMDVSPEETEHSSSSTRPKKPNRSAEGKSKRPTTRTENSRVKPSPKKATPVKEDPVSQEPIEPQEGREYWEAWVDSKNQVTIQSTEMEMVSIEPTVAKESSVHASSSTTDAAPEIESTESNETEPNETGPVTPKLYLNIGKRHGLNQARLHSLLVEKGLPEYPVQIRFTHSYLLPPEEKMEEVITSLHGVVYRNRTLLCERARK